MAMINGIELTISPASFGEVMGLQLAITKALKSHGIKFDLSSLDLGAENLEKMELGDIGWIIEPVITLATDEEIRKHLFNCAKRGLFGKYQINEDFFEDTDNRKYFYPIMIEVLKVNIGPFFGLVSSLFSRLGSLSDFLRKPGLQQTSGE